MSWSTKAETTFIKNLGTGKYATLSSKVADRTRGEMLELYLKATKLRKTWTGMNKNEIISYAEEMLRYYKPEKREVDEW